MSMQLDLPPITVPEWTYASRFECEGRSAARARAFVSHHLIEHRLLRLVEPVRTAASELAANAIVHARTPFTVTLSGSGSLVELCVADSAVQTPVRPPVQGAVLVMAEGGRGLHIIAALSRDWGFATAENNTKSVWATFDAGRPGEGGDWS